MVAWRDGHVGDVVQAQAQAQAQAKNGLVQAQAFRTRGSPARWHTGIILCSLSTLHL
jgi:hypothetical protein